jgi:glutamine amidotransferase
MGKKSVLISNILIKPEHSLVKQSLSSRESSTVTNGDGFGLGWYTSFDKEPALFTSLYPAWNDQNLSFLARKTKAHVFFGHVRAASCGGISQFNCHPFINKNWMFMHNGGIPHFEKIKRELQESLDDDLFKWIKGNTDSEVIFGVFLQLLKNSPANNLSEIALKLHETFELIERMVKKYHAKSVSHFNICITDGQRLVASRYCTSKYTKPETMYLSLNQKQEAKPVPHIIVASEKFTKSSTGWKLIPTNSILMVEPNLEYSYYKCS